MIQLRLDTNTLFLDGDLEHGDIALLETALPAHLATIRSLDCMDLDIEDGAALACLARVLKDAARAGRITIHGAPQLLAHTLYRVNALDRFDWPALRWDEASTQ